MKMIILITAVTVLMSTSAFSQQGRYGYMDGGWYMMHYGYGSIIMWISLIILIVLLGYLLIQAIHFLNHKTLTHESAMDILKKRYAKGEITKEEFERMKQDLKN